MRSRLTIPVGKINAENNDSVVQIFLTQSNGSTMIRRADEIGWDRKFADRQPGTLMVLPYEILPTVPLFPTVQQINPSNATKAGLYSWKVFDALFNPSSVAVVGASSSPGKVGHDIFVNILSGGFTGILISGKPQGQIHRQQPAPFPVKHDKKRAGQIIAEALDQRKT